MRLSLGWLAEWIELPARAEDLAERLTMAGLEVDALERTGPKCDGVVVGEVLERGAHPGADRLSLCRVDVGEDEPVAIVCGAANVDAGQKVAVARPGVQLPDGTRIKKSKIRGEVSLGMICSERELGLSSEQEGILVLEASAEVGTPVEAWLSGGDTILEVALLANRGDCASVLGLAREVHAYTGKTIALPPTQPSEGTRLASEDIEVVIRDVAGCALYDARVVRGLLVAESAAQWVQRLGFSGIRARSNVVDISNQVMLEWGQPLHFFDLDRIRGGRIEVRAAVAGETLVTLDGETRSLEADDLVIADAEGPIALAGVMGGRDTEVVAGTRNVLIEAAIFDPVRIRRTASRLGLTSAASYRFERGVDAEGTARAVDRAARLLFELGGEVSKGRVRAAGTAVARPGVIRADPGQATRLLGTPISGEDMALALGRLGIAASARKDGCLDVTIPSFRNDLWLEEDLIEEVARLRGFGGIESKQPRIEPGLATRPAGARETAALQDRLCAEGLTEVLCLPFSPASDPQALRLEADDPRRGAVSVLNPIVDGEAQLRTSLLPSLLRRVAENRSRQVGSVAIFEIARVFLRQAEAAALPQEPLALCAVLAPGSDAGLWDAVAPPLFYRAKGLAERLLGSLERGPVGSCESGHAPYLHPGASTALEAAGQPVAYVGELHPETASAFGLSGPVAVIEIDLEAVLALPLRPARYEPVSKHPQVQRDLAVLLEASQPAGEVALAIRKAGGALLQSVEIFDRYEGEGLGPEKVSVAFRLVYQHADRTLRDAEVSKATDRVVRMLAHRFGGELR